MIESLKHISNNILKNLDYSRLEEFSYICSFKYFVFNFGLNYFTINYSFHRVEHIVKDMIDIHLKDFYDYKKNECHSGSANADFFELFAGQSIKDGKLKLPESS